MTAIKRLSRTTGDYTTSDLDATELHTNFQFRSDDSSFGNDDLGDEGYPYVVELVGTGVVNPAISGGWISAPGLSTNPGAIYLNRAISGKVLWIGGSFKFAAGTVGSAMALVAWDRTDVTPLTGINSHFHWAIGKTNHQFGYWENGVSTTLLDEYHTSALTEGVEYTAEGFVDGDTAYLILPSGEVRRVIHSKIASLSGNVACHEFYHPVAANSLVSMRRIWAHPALGVPGLPSMHQAAKMVAASHSSRLGVQLSNGTYTVDPYSPGDQDITALADTVIAAPTSPLPPYGRKMLISVVASGATRAVSVHSSIVAVGGATTSYSLAANKVAVFGIRFNPLNNTWQLLTSGTSP